MLRCLIALGLCLIPSAGVASDLFAVNLSNVGLAGLLTIDPASGEVGDTVALASEFPRGSVVDLASDPFRAPSVVWAAYRQSIIGVNPYAGAVVSELPIDVGTASLSGLAIDPIDGAMYALIRSSTSNSSLMRVDRQTGALSHLGDLEIPLSPGLGFTSDGRLLAFNESSRYLVEIDTDSAAPSDLFEVPTLGTLHDVAFRPEDGALFATTYSPYSLSRIDIDSETVTEVGPSLLRPAGLAFASLPEPSASVLMVLLATSLNAFGSPRPA